MKTAAASFSGNFSGSIFLSIPPSLLNTMTENFMGQDISTLSEAHVDGTLKEALNMIAGNALTRVDNTSYMGLGIPEILSDPGQDNTDASVTLHTLDDILIARVKLNSLGDPNG
ncbi:MAG: chemotaxis protein CheX [Desulfobacter sp.]|nr:chemotaxis protein CheX [Desulfobacter sp.]